VCLREERSPSQLCFGRCSQHGGISFQAEVVNESAELKEMQLHLGENEMKVDDFKGSVFRLVWN
jgi:hypothetical protein